ncbi:hypothetical protein PF008_g8337 [Phytophthora fragariae]|uniref:Tc1-like transposase DDE domain-containing protein n=1 Tax=Phytophthora fragariae TaxID=53985 RepID=A0A6G0RZZ2_9STRA|nr:hypothetical protein PF008_g8337 [Phytophthora fragariae]
MLIGNLLPALHERLSAATSESRIVIKQDNAPAQIAEADAVFAEAARASGCNVELCNQPPNSPDMNCNDLGLFSAVQAQQRKKRSRTIDELIEAGISSY